MESLEKIIRRTNKYRNMSKKLKEIYNVKSSRSTEELAIGVLD